MTPVQVRDYEVTDYFSIERSTFLKTHQHSDDPEQDAFLHKYAGPCHTILAPDNAIIACIGIHRLWTGTGEVWGIFSPLMRKYPMAWFKVKELLAYYQDRNGFTRLHAVVRCDWEDANRFISHLGFTAEGVMRAYGPWGADMTMYALVKGGHDG